jgi:HAMP domain-containing protein
MTVSVSERLREALERLDQAIDRLDSGVAAGNNGAEPPAKSETSADAGALALRLDRMIERIETALAD